MAWEQDSPYVGGFKAAHNYSCAAAQFSVVKPSSAAQFSWQVKSTQFAMGVLQDRPTSGSAGNIKVSGITKVQVSTNHGAIAVGDKLCPSTAGGFGHVTLSTLATKYVIGRALEAMSSNTAGLITMMFTHQGGGSTYGAAAA